MRYLILVLFLVGCSSRYEVGKYDNGYKGGNYYCREYPSWSIGIYDLQLCKELNECNKFCSEMRAK